MTQDTAWLECPEQRVAAFLEKHGSVLCLDIGSGTQDAVLALPHTNPENWPRFVLPTPARKVARDLRTLTAKKLPVWLHGTNMGGGFGGAVREHLAAGLPIASTFAAATALHDSVERIAGMGVTFADTCPAGYTPLALADYEAVFWERLFTLTDLPCPAFVVAAAQDHGVHPETGVGNRQGRFAMWRALLEQSDGHPAKWLFHTPPPALTRLVALSRATGGPVADTGTAAVLGALAAPEVAARSQRQGVTVVNVGNSHVVAFLVYQGKVLGIYEQHTGSRTTQTLTHDLKEFRLGWLPDEVVRAEGGHGVVLRDPLPPEAEGFTPTFIVGPQRELLRGHGQFVAPHGDMMVAGCHGLLLGMVATSL